MQVEKRYYADYNRLLNITYLVRTRRIGHPAAADHQVPPAEVKRAEVDRRVVLLGVRVERNPLKWPRGCVRLHA